MNLDGIAPLVTDPLRDDSTARQNPPICNSLIDIDNNEEEEDGFHLTLKRA